MRRARASPGRRLEARAGGASVLFIVPEHHENPLDRSTAFDTIVGVIVGSLLSWAINGGAPLTPTLGATGAVVALHWTTGFVSHEWEGFDRAFNGSKTVLIADGRMNHHAMRMSALSHRDIEESARLRVQSSEIEVLYHAFLERNGSIVTWKPREPRGWSRSRWLKGSTGAAGARVKRREHGMAQRESKKAIYAAIASNLAIAISKFIAAAISRSSSMIAVGVPSTVDTGNGLLMFLGLRRAGKDSDPVHPFGYSQKLYFWTFVVATGIFAAGGGASIWEGGLHLLHPEELKDPRWAYIVLAIAIVFEGITWVFGLQAFLEEKGEQQGVVRAIHTSKDPNSFIVLFEDSALAALLVAAAGVWLSHQFHEPRIDSVASIVSCLLLCAVAWLLATESKGLLIGERADPDTEGDISRLALAEEGVGSSPCTSVRSWCS